MSEEKKSGSSMNYAYLEAYRKRKKESLASEIDFSEDNTFLSGNTSGNSAFLESFRRRKKKLIAAELNIVKTSPEAPADTSPEVPAETSPEVLKEKNYDSSQSVPHNRGSFIPVVKSDEKQARHFKSAPKNHEPSVPAIYDGETLRKKESDILSDSVNNQRGITDNSITDSKRRFKRFSEKNTNENFNDFFDEPTSDSDLTLMTSDLDSHSVLSFPDMESDSFESFSDMESDTFQSNPDLNSDSASLSAGFNSNAKSDSGKENRKNNKKTPSKGKAKVAVLLSVVVMIVCGFIVISKMRNDSMISNDENTSSFTQDNTGSSVSKATEQTEYATDTTSNNSTTATTSESTTESSEMKTTTTVATKHYETLSPGQRGDDVMKMQKRLAKLGYIKKDSCTGYYGETTEKIIKMFQGKAKLKQTGIADSETLSRLYADDAPDCLHGEE